ncbi:hypothetical protein EOT10_04140 [Streptomyces antnestii]|uniref:Gluconate 2-dehydrogenase subunit 3 family protein n=1 Tax=Streptomyces antnestii TaxID=2494256 RepID=A0A3S2VLQ2_9ACTN|nr:hypothetical protein [Streptomyces sp. San01]RVU29033.1 hypothetical protein EOT10_04140 [Streptomyces sp. San01]
MTVTVNVSLTGRARLGAIRLADLWFPGSAVSPAMTALPEYAALLDVALAANAELTAAFLEIAERAADVAELTAQTLENWPADVVEGAYTVAMCAYYMSKAVRTAIGYPGQQRVPAARDIGNPALIEELLAPVLARGALYVATPALQ